LAKILISIKQRQ